MSGELKHKMYDYEVKPPQAVWDSIADGLNEQELLKPLAEKMHAWEVTPPAAVWRKIAVALKSGAPVKSMSFQKIYRWSAAAAIILMAGAWYFLNYSDTARSVVHTNTKTNMHDESEQTLQEAYSNTNNKKVFVSPVKLVSSSRYNTQKIYSEEDIRILPLSYVEDTDPFADDQIISVTPRPILTADGELIQDMSVVNPHNDKYISITAPNGQQTKISSRLINATHYLSSNTINEEGDNAEDTENTWQQRIQQWRKKILQSGFVPSSSNFLDILEMTDLVDDKQQQ